MQSLQYKGKKTGKRINIESFDSLSELLQCNNSRTELFGESRPAMSQRLGFSSWETLENSVFSYRKDVKRLREKIKAATTKGLVKRGEKLAVEGGNPCVPAYLMGHPNTMINQRIKKSPGKFLEIYIDAAYSWNVPKGDIEEYFEGVVEYVSALSAQGFRISLSLLGSLSSPTDTHSSTVIVKIKAPGEKFNLKKLMFAMSHEAMFRGVIFDWYHRCPHAVEINNYGIPLYLWDRKNKEQFLDDLGIDHRLIYYKSDYKEIIGGK